MGYLLDKLAEEILIEKLAADEAAAEAATEAKKPGIFKRFGGWANAKRKAAWNWAKTNPKKTIGGTAGIAGLIALEEYLRRNKKGPFA